jgi:hypothetical protein
MRWRKGRVILVSFGDFLGVRRCCWLNALGLNGLKMEILTPNFSMVALILDNGEMLLFA